MKKFALILAAFVLICSGLFGAYYFFQVYRAGQEIRTALVYLQEENYTQALDTLRRTIGRYTYEPVQEASRYLIAESYRREGSYQAAVNSYRELLHDKAATEGSYWRIKALISLSQLYRNVSLAAPQRRARVLEVLKEEVYRLLVVEKGRYDVFPRQGRRWWKSLVYAVMLNGEYVSRLQLNHGILVVELRTELGYLSLETGELERAERHLAGIETPRARFGLARVYLESGPYEQGLHVLEALIPRDRTGKVYDFYQDQALKTAHALHDQCKTAQALALYERVLDRGDGRYQDLAGYRLARHYYREKKYSTALGYLDRVLANDVDLMDEQATLMKGYLLYDQREYVQALQTFNRFISRYPNSGQLPAAREWKEMCERVIRYYG